MTNSLVIANSIQLLGGGVSQSAGLAQGAYYYLQSGWDLSAPQPTVDITGQLILDGERPYGRRASNRTIKIPILILAPDKTTLAAAREALLMLIDQPTWTLTWIRDGGQLPIIFDCFRAQPTVQTYSIPYQDRALACQLAITFESLPYGRNDQQQQIPVLNPPSTIPGLPSPPPPPIVIDDFYPASGTAIEQSTICLIGPYTAEWDPNLVGDPHGNDTVLSYTGTLGSGSGISFVGYTAISFWLGAGSRDWWHLEHHSRTKITVYFTLTDVSGNKISFHLNKKIPVANSLTKPAWTQISAAIPQNKSPFSYGAVSSYRIKITNGGDGEDELSHVVAWLDSLTITAGSRIGAAPSVRGCAYVVAGVQGTSHAPINVQATQPDSSAFSTLLLHRPGPDAPDLLMPFVPVGNGNDTPDGKTEYPIPSLVTPVPLNSNSQFPTVVTPWTPYDSATLAWSNVVWPFATSAVINNTSGGVNLLAVGSGQAWGFETSIGYWVPGSNCTVAQSTAQAHAGTHSLAYTATAAATGYALSCLAANITTQGLPVSPGDAVSGSIWFRAATTGRSVNIGIDFYDNSGTALSGNLRGSNVSDTTTGWVQATVSGNAPANAAFMRLSASVVSPGNGEVHYLDDAFITDTSDPGMASEQVAVTPANWYQVSALLYSPQGWSNCQIGINWYDVSHNYLGSAYSASMNVPAAFSAGTTLTSRPVQAPTAAAYGQMFVQLTGNPASTIQLAVDNAVLASAPLPARFGGSYSILLVASSWHNSTASRNVTVTLNQYASPGGLSWSQAVSAAVVPGGGAPPGGGSSGMFIGRIATGKLNSSSGTSFTASVSKATIPGNSLIVQIGYGINASSGVNTVSDGTANVYSLVYAASLSSTGGRGYEVWACLNPTVALTSSNKFTITLLASCSNGAAVIVDEYSQLAAVTTETGYTSGGSSSVNSLNPSATMLGTDVIALSGAVNFTNDNAPSVRSPWKTTGSDAEASVGGSGLSMNAAYTTVSAAGSLTAQWSWGDSHTASAVVVGFPVGGASTGANVNPFAVIGEITLPLRDVPPDNTLGYFTLTVQSSDTSDSFLDVLLIDTTGQTLWVNELSNSYVNYFVDEPDANRLIGRILGSQIDRSDASSVLPESVLSGGTLTLEPGDDLLLAYCVEGAPSLALSYFPRWFFDRVY
jgi:hypothetical protein